MKITKKNLDDAVEQGVLSAEQSNRLLDFLRSQPSVGPSFNFTHLLYYLGGLIAIGAMTLFMTLAWESFGGWGILAISLLYALGGLLLANNFAKKGLAIPAGICATFAVCLTPLAIYGFQQAMGFWPDDSQYRDYHRVIEWHWLYMELGTLLVGVIIARLYKYPFLILPIAVTLWYLSMDVAAMLMGGDNDYQFRSFVSMCFGILMVGLAFWVDLRSRNTGDYAFWLYIFGAITFWAGLTFQSSDLEWSKFVYFCINLLMIGVGVLLIRRVFVILGAIGCTVYLQHLASNVFQDSVMFPIALTAIGLCIVYLGVVWQKHEQSLSAKVRRFMPQAVRELLDARDS